MIGTTTRT